MDVSTFILGILVGVAGAFSTGFLSKAGEHFYAWLHRKISPLPDPKPAQLVIQLPDEAVPVTHIVASSQGSKNSLAGPDSHQTNPYQDSAITADHVMSTYKAAPPLQRDTLAKGFAGVPVTWDAIFQSGRVDESGMANLNLWVYDHDDNFESIYCNVSLNDYRQLSVLPKGASMRVSGKIGRISLLGINLEDVSLIIFGRKGTG